MPPPPPRVKQQQSRTAGSQRHYQQQEDETEDDNDEEKASVEKYRLSQYLAFGPLHLLSKTLPESQTFNSTATRFVHFSTAQRVRSSLLIGCCESGAAGYTRYLLHLLHRRVSLESMARLLTLVETEINVAPHTILASKSTTRHQHLTERM